MDTRMRGYDRVVLGYDRVVSRYDRIVRGCGNAQDVLGGGRPCGRMVERVLQNALLPAVNGMCGKVGI